MLALSPSQRILLAVQPVDFRKGIDGLIGLCRQRLNENPLLGTLFVFTNRRRTALKLLIYDGQGFFLILKRFSQGRLRWWPDGPETGHALAARELNILLWNDIRRRQHGLRYGGHYILHPQHRMIVPWQPQPHISAQLMPMLEESLQVTKRIHSRLGGRLDHAHEEAAHGRTVAGLEEVTVLAEQ